MKHLLVFLANVAIDVLAVNFILQVTKKRRIRAGLVSAALVYLYAITTIYIIESHQYIIPAVAGAFLGTVLTVRKD